MFYSENDNLNKLLIYLTYFQDKLSCDILYLILNIVSILHGAISIKVRKYYINNSKIFSSVLHILPCIRCND